MKCPGHHFHTDMLRMQRCSQTACFLLVAYISSAKVYQNFGNIYFYRTHLVAGTAQTGGIGKGGCAFIIRSPQLWSQDGPYGSGIDRMIGMSPGAFVYRADIQASAASYTV